MKQIMKKALSAGSALLLAGVLMVFGACSVFAEDMEEMLKTQLVMMAEGLTQTILPLSDEEIESYKESADAFTASSMEAWSSVKKELGTEGESGGESVFEASDDGYTVTVPMVFDKTDANFVYNFDEMGTPVAMSVDIQYPLSVNLQRAGLNTLMGLATVFIMLIFLSFVISLFKYIPKLMEGKKKDESAPAPAAPAPAAAPVQTDDSELIAVIAAAIAASEGTTTDDFVVRSIRKINRKKW